MIRFDDVFESPLADVPELWAMPVAIPQALY